MSNVIKLRRSAVSGNVPTTSQIELGEMAINTADGVCYIKRNDGSGDEIVRVGGSSTLQSTRYRFETSTSNSPGGGKMHFNAAFGTDYSSVTEIYLNNTDKAGQDLSNLFSAFLGDTYRIYVQKESDATKAVVFQVTGAPTVGASVTTIPVSFVKDTSSALSGGKDCVVLFSSDPSANLTLSGLADVSAPSPSDGQVLTWVDGNSQWEPQTNVSSQWVDGSDPGDIYYNGGSVGIGTTNPFGALEVTDGQVFLSASEDPNYYWYAQLESGTGDLEIIGTDAITGSEFYGLTMRRTEFNSTFVAINSNLANCPLDINYSNAATNRPTIRLREYRPAIRWVDMSTNAIDAEMVMDGNLLRWRFGEEPPTQVSDPLASEVMTLDSSGNLSLTGAVTANNIPTNILELGDVDYLSEQNRFYYDATYVADMGNIYDGPVMKDGGTVWFSSNGDADFGNSYPTLNEINAGDQVYFKIKGQYYQISIASKTDEESTNQRVGFTTTPSNALADLLTVDNEDVFIMKTPDNGNALVWDDTNKEWVAAAVGSSAPISVINNFGSYTCDLSLGNNFWINGFSSANITLSNVTPGATGFIRVTAQNPLTMTYNSNFKWPGGTPPGAQGPFEDDWIEYYCASSTIWFAKFHKNMS